MGDAIWRPAVTAWNAFSHRGRAVTAEERVVVRGNRSEKEAWQVSVDWAACWYSVLQMCRSVYTLCLWE